MTALIGTYIARLWYYLLPNLNTNPERPKCSKTVFNLEYFWSSVGIIVVRFFIRKKGHVSYQNSLLPSSTCVAIVTYFLTCWPLLFILFIFTSIPCINFNYIKFKNIYAVLWIRTLVVMVGADGSSEL